MLKSIFKSALVLAVLVVSVKAFSQTVIDYSTWTPPTYCNIFKYIPSPPAPQANTVEIQVNNFKHLTAIGTPAYSGSAVQLKSNVDGNNQVAGTEYRITYNFKQYYTYKITVNTKREDVGTAAGGPIGLRLNITPSGTYFENQCNGPSLNNLSPSDGQKQSKAPTLNNFNDLVFDYPFLQQASGYLMLAAILPGNLSNEQNIYIKKITITETAPTPTFTITPSSPQVPCGSTTPQTFTINNVYNSPGTIVYNWNLGSASNGWLYDAGAGLQPAPQTFPTSTNSISLTPSGTTLLSNVAVNVSLNGTNYPLTSTVTRSTNFSINGDNAVCGTSNNYTISNLPVSATVQWSSSPTGIVTINNPTSQQTTLTKINNGVVTLTATISNACTASPVSISKTSIAIGTPYIIMGYDDGSGTTIGTEESPEINTVCQTGSPTQVHTNLEIPGATSVTWTRVQDINGRVTSGAYDANNISLGFRLAGQSVLFQLDATNGCGTTTKQYIFASENCGQRYSISPNPASSTATISTNESATKTSSLSQEGITEITIYDQSGNLKKHQKYSKTKKATLNTSGLKSGIYFMEIINGTRRERQQLIIRQ